MMRHWLFRLFVLCLLAGCGQRQASPGGATLTPPAATATAQPATSTPLPAGPTAPPATATPAPLARGWWADAIFYELFVRSFYDGDGDGHGDLPGLLMRLDYLNDGDPAGGQDLGVTALWLMPVAASASYHGYDVTDYTRVDPDYGTNDDFRRLVDEAHRRGVRVIVDLVLNHTSSRHPWFLDSAAGPDAARRDWYIWSAEDPGYSGPWGEPVWHSLDGAYYYGVFWSGMPDLNLENEQVTAALHDVARYWLEEMDVDGFRLDAARHYVEDGKEQVNTAASHTWLRGLNAYSKSVEPEMMTVVEVMDVSDAVATYAGDDADLAFEFSLAKSILLSVNENRATPLESAMKEAQRLYPNGEYASFLTNHDQNRVMDALGRDPHKARLAATILFTLPGVPFVYYGEEVGMTGSKPDEQIRTPMQWTAGAQAGFTAGTPWQPVNPGYEAWNVEVQAADPGSLLNHYRALIAVRRAHPALRSISYDPLRSTGKGVAAYLRQGEGEAILVVLNLGLKEASDYGLSLASSDLAPGSYTAVDLLGGAGAEPLLVGAEGAVDGYRPLAVLPAQGALVLALTPAGP